MFNVRGDKDWPGFAVGLPEEITGFSVGDDGLPLSDLASRPTSPFLLNAPSAGIPAAIGDLLLQTGGPIGPESITTPQDRFIGNPYWPVERDRRMASPIVPAGYGSPLSPVQRPRAEETQTTPPWRSDSTVNAEQQGVPDASVPSAGGLPSGIGSPQSPIIVQYRAGGGSSTASGIAASEVARG
jgi:hypothetical protein